jgi:hypothetical protein
LEDAERAAQKASRGIETAKRNAGEAAAGTQTAAATLNYLLSQLSPAERKLYTALQNIQQAYKDTYRPITDIIINSFTRGVNRVAQIIQMPKVVDLARRTAGTLSRQLNRVFDGLTSDKMIDQFIRSVMLVARTSSRWQTSRSASASLLPILLKKQALRSGRCCGSSEGSCRTSRT